MAKGSTKSVQKVVVCSLPLVLWSAHSYQNEIDFVENVAQSVVSQNNYIIGQILVQLVVSKQILRQNLVKLCIGWFQSITD